MILDVAAAGITGWIWLPIGGIFIGGVLFGIPIGHWKATRGR